MNKTPQRVIDKRNEWAMSDNERDKNNREPQNIEIAKNISYKVCNDGAILKLDVYHPKKVKGLLPVIFSIHGGGYFYGDKELYRFYTMSLAERGFTVVNIDYRLSPEYRFPCAIEDIFDALCWVGENIKDFCGDPMKIMLVGDSAGAQLASQFGALFSNQYYANLYGFVFPNTFNIIALSLACGFYDLENRALIEADKTLMEDYLGPDFTGEDERLKVYDYINGNYPPSYVFSSDEDFLRESCEPFSKLLTDHGVYSEWKIYRPDSSDHLYHVFHCDLKLPEATLANDEQVDFFRRILNK